MATVKSVNVGQIAEVTWGGRSFTTAIRKHAVAGRVPVVGVNLAGDDQADRSVHGGEDKAVYGYAMADYDWWAREGGVSLAPATFGENLTLDGVDLGACKIGERWRVGTALLEVSEPRLPCFKLGYRMNDPGFVRTFSHALRPGSYFRILEEGDVAAGDAAERLFQPQDHDVTVREVMRIRLFAPGERARLLSVERLPADWREWALAEAAR